MRNLKTQKNTAIACAMAFCVVAASAPVLAKKSETEHVRGVVSAMSDSGFTVKTDNGENREIAMSSATKIAAATPGDLSNIEEGTFIGTANVEKNGKNEALEMVIFPPSMKGVGLGDYGWDLSPSMVNESAISNEETSEEGGMASGSSMTNGTVQSRSSDSDAMMSSGSSMTNGTVTDSSSTEQTLTLHVNYGEGSKTIHVPTDVPTVKVRPGKMSDISEGAHIFVAGPKGSSPLQAKMVIVGVDGTVPPM